MGANVWYNQFKNKIVRDEASPVLVQGSRTETFDVRVFYLRSFATPTDGSCV